MDTFFPYVPLLIERYDFVVNELDAVEKRECLVPFVYIVKNLSRELTSAWWKRETEKRQVNFFLTLKLCLELGVRYNWCIYSSFLTTVHSKVITWVS